MKIIGINYLSESSVCLLVNGNIINAISEERINRTKNWYGLPRKTIDFILNRIEAPFFDRCVAKYGWHRTNKALLETAGLMRRHDRMPLKHLSAGEFMLVEEVYQEIQMSIEELFT